MWVFLLEVLIVVELVGVLIVLVGFGLIVKLFVVTFWWLEACCCCCFVAVFVFDRVGMR